MNSRKLKAPYLSVTSETSRNSQRFASVIHASRISSEMLAFLIVVCFLSQSRHTSGRFPSGVALLHLIAIRVSPGSMLHRVWQTVAQLLLSRGKIAPRERGSRQKDMAHEVEVHNGRVPTLCDRSVNAGASAPIARPA
jgi:hypothetical protein